LTLRGTAKKESPGRPARGGLQVKTYRDFLTGIIIPVRKVL
jgi:hypothetical protein